MSEINWKDKCWVAVIYLIDNNKILLHWNKNMQTWIPIGGHIELGETPEQAVIREVKEETGLDFDFLDQPRVLGNSRIITPFRFQVDDVPHHNHHMAFVYIGKCKNSSNQQATDENEELRWFTKNELLELKDKMIVSVWDASLQALELATKQQ